MARRGALLSPPSAASPSAPSERLASGASIDTPANAPADAHARCRPDRAGPVASTTHLVLIPSYNPGRVGIETVRAARAYWNPVWVVVDGSSDGSAETLTTMAAADPGLRTFVLARNQGKGAAVLYGARLAQAHGFTHALTMDCDGQHPPHCIAAFMQASRAEPAAVILGEPRFGPDAPALRVRGRRISNWWANVETLWAGIHDSLFGFRVYPLAALVETMSAGRWMRRFDFDPEVAVRLCWRGLPMRNLPAPVRYLRPDEGGVSHFNYWRDNVLLSWMHARLMSGAAARLPRLLWRRLARPRPRL